MKTWGKINDIIGGLLLAFFVLGGIVMAPDLLAGKPVTLGDGSQMGAGSYGVFVVVLILVIAAAQFGKGRGLAVVSFLAFLGLLVWAALR